MSGFSDRAAAEKESRSIFFQSAAMRQQRRQIGDADGAVGVHVAVLVEIPGSRRCGVRRTERIWSTVHSGCACTTHATAPAVIGVAKDVPLTV